MYFKYKSFVSCICYKYFLLIYGLSFGFLYIFWCACIYYSLPFKLVHFGFFFKKLFLMPRSRRYSTMFLSKSFIALSFTFRSLSHLLFIYFLVYIFIGKRYHARPPCPSQTPRVYSNSHPLSWWCHPAISSSVVPFSFCPQTLPAQSSAKICTQHDMRWWGENIFTFMHLKHFSSNSLR